MKTSLSLIITTSALISLPASAAVLLNDSFGGEKNTITGSSDGQTGTLAGINRVERNFNANAIVDGAGRLRFDNNTTNGNEGSIVYYDNNFTGLNAFTVTLESLTGSSAGNGRVIGFSVGQTKANLDAVSGTSPANSVADFFIGYDMIDDTGLSVFHNGTSQGFLGSPTLSSPDNLSVVFTFADMNATTALNYAVYLDDAFVGSGSTAWSGTDENYIAMQSTYSDTSFISSFELTNVPEPTSFSLLALGLGGLMLRRRK